MAICEIKVITKKHLYMEKITMEIKVKLDK